MQSDQDHSGKRYELVVQEIFHSLLNQNEVENIDVRHNVTLQGKTTTHQVDVYWEFEKGGIRYRTVVQAKDWATPVVQGELLKFKSVLDDLPQQPRGVFVTRTGYQDGAKEYAQAHGITLYELSEESEEPDEPNLTATVGDWVRFKGEVRGFQNRGKLPTAIRLSSTVFHPRCSNVTLDIDKAWLDKNALTRDIDASSLKFEPRLLSEIILYDDQQRAISDLETILREELEVIRKENVTEKKAVHAFDQPTFLGPETTNLTYIRLNKVVFDIEIETTHRAGSFNLNNLVQFMLREIPDGKPLWFIKPKE
jgi:Restriction endonuclease